MAGWRDGGMVDAFNDETESQMNGQTQADGPKDGQIQNTNYRVQTDR